MAKSGHQEQAQLRILESRTLEGPEPIVGDGGTRKLDASSEVSAPSSPLCNILEHITHGIIVMDRERRVVAWNRQFQEIIRFPDELLKVGLPSHKLGLFLARRGDYGEGNPQDLNARRLAFLWAGGSTRSEIHLGDGRDYEVLATPTPDGGLVITYTDITERKRAEEALRLSEERYALAASGTNDGLWDWNIRTDEDYFSPRWKEIVGYLPSDLEPAMQSFVDLVHPDDREPMFE
ncbi:MAG: PAS-domain containing protein, partial [Alphaproteobacteria bacterium]